MGEGAGAESVFQMLSVKVVPRYHSAGLHFLVHSSSIDLFKRCPRFLSRRLWHQRMQTGQRFVGDPFGMLDVGTGD